MLKKHKIFRMMCILFFFTGFISRVVALDTPVINLSESDKSLADTGVLLLNNAVQKIWANAGTPDDNRALLDRSKILFESINDEAIRSYFLAQIELAHGRIDLDYKEKVQSRTHFEAAIELAQNSVDLRESSDGYQLLASAGASWMMTKGLGGILSMAPKVQEWSDRSLEINPQNVFATIISIQGQLNAPKFAGGNPQEAYKRLETLLLRNDLSDIEQFWALVSFAQASTKLKQKDKAKRLCEQARTIFPENIMFKDCR